MIQTGTPSVGPVLKGCFFLPSFQVCRLLSEVLSMSQPSVRASQEIWSMARAFVDPASQRPLKE